MPITQCAKWRSTPAVSRHRPTNAARQARKRDRLIALGLVQYRGWFFPHVLADLRETEQTLRDHRHLTVGPLLDPVSGKFVSRRNGRAK
jgi:hypothetical protein